jgi:hypothetical protein
MGLPAAGGQAGGEEDENCYLASQLFLACFWASSFWCLAARFSLMERPGFLLSPVCFDFSPIDAEYGVGGFRQRHFPRL